MKTITPIPFDELTRTFGEPGTQRDFVTRELPFIMRASWNDAPITKFFGHQYIADAAIEAWQEILDIYGAEFIRSHGLDEYAGCYADRKAKGADRPSVHAWGLAVDYMPSRGPWRGPPMTPLHVVEAFEKRGFIWGGRWENARDAMHFSGVIE